MGYAHYWNRPIIIDSETFIAIGHDFQQLQPLLERAGAPLANAYGREEPEIGPEFIGFNGVAHCGHDRNPEVLLPWPTREAHGIGSNHGMAAALPYRTCNGDCSYESVWFERCQTVTTQHERVDGGCKTAFRPYDLAVMAFLIVARHHLRGAFIVQTDGEPSHWAEAFSLCQAQLGYGCGYSFAGNQLHIPDEVRCA